MGSRDDLSGRAVVILAFLAMAAVAWLDLTDGTLGIAFSIGFILIVLTAPMAVSLRSIVTTGVLPPILLVVSILTIVLVNPAAVPLTDVADDASGIARAIAATLDQGLTLVIGHVLALFAILVRTTWAAKARTLRAATS